MNITIFNRKYWIRRFGEQRKVKGYYTSDYEDFVASLHVHPMGTDQLQALPEGERSVKHLEGHGSDILVAADQDKGIKGDYLFYKGDWYECTSAQEYDHTLLSHYNYQFVIIPKDSADSGYTLNIPETDPDEWNGGDTS